MSAEVARRAPARRPASVIVAVLVALVASVFAGTVPARADVLPPVAPADTISLTGEPRVGQTVTANVGVWTPEGVTFSYEWLSDDVVLDGQTQPQLVLAPELLGSSVKVRVTGSADGYTPASKDSDAVVVTKGVLSSTPLPTITGAAKVGSPLVVDGGSWDEGVTLDYQWLSEGTPIIDATDPTFTPDASHLGSAITVEVSGSMPGYESVTKTSGATAAVAPGDLVAGVPTVSGTARVGEALSGQTGTWSPVPDYSYQWFVAGAPIAAATGTTFVPEAVDQGKAVTLRVTGALPGYTSRAALSVPVVIGSGVYSVAPTPSIGGVARVGSPLTANTGGWAPVPTFSYQWFADGAAISGATGSSFTPAAIQRGKRLSVQVTATRSGFPTTTRTSAQTAAVAYGVFTAAPTPTISGTARVGAALKAMPGIWSPSATLSYQWRADGAAVTGATGSSFTPQAAQRGKRITVTVAARRDGFTPATRTSAATTFVAYGVFTAAPTPRISGYPQIGWALTATAGTWAPWASVSYQWKANGVAIKGATASTYKPVSADYAKRITVTVTAKRPGYSNGVRTSAATIPVTKPFTRIATPTIAGTARVFSTLTVKPGYWYPAPTFGYQWKRNGVVITGATRSTYRLVEADYGKRVTVSVTARRSGFTPVTRTSAASATILGPAATLTKDGTFRVGVSLGPGTYVAPGGYGCYWERRRNAGTDFDGIIANDFSLGGRRIVTISSTDAYFVTEDCGSWTRLAKVGTPRTSFGEGAQAVGVHIRPGYYYAPGGDGCYWEGLSGFSGLFGDVIENDFSYYEPQYVHIYSWVVGFDSHDCGTWTRIGD
ncbi:hypothetical protein [Terracoccus sp. 273MFTsu3.1]|uniref:hypothetical protein n=1 Tax=Terracoccus sp. 273MFTsu3.1 TaxID=1172188 RepID=UPI000368B067|nr:hypothetical protein [Terracoccus sp. 273MFTsu3.1]